MQAVEVHLAFTRELSGDDATFAELSLQHIK